jgi:hypothetical protein
MRKLLVFILCFVASSAYGQQDTAKVPEYGWKHSLVAGLTLTQIAFTNWAAGGQNALSWTTFLEGKSVKDQEMTNWTTSYKFGFGQTRLGNQGLRKTDDKIDLETILTYRMGTYINPYAAATFKSQFAKGFKYDDDAGTKTAVSQFFDPAYLTQSVGVGYQPTPEVKTRFGVALREVIADKFATIYTDDFETINEIEKSRVDGGLESVTDVELKLDENLLFTSRLELFAPFKTLDEIVVRSDNTLLAKVNKYVTVILNVLLINEKRITPRTQIKETLAIGLSYTLL